MSLAFPVAVLLAGIFAAVVLAVARKLVLESTCIGCVAAAVAFPFLCALSFPLALAIGTSEGTDLSHSEVDGWLNLRLPSQATGIDYYQHFHQICEVDFDIAEGGFLEWCDEQSWTPVPLDGDITVRPLANPPSNRSAPIVVGSGYVATTAPRNGDFGGSVTYDRDRGRAFYRFSSF